jgi:acetylornithine deacetylase
MIDKIAQILCELISIESISANSNLDIIAYIEKILASSGVSARCVLSSDGRKASLLATIGPADRPGLVLSAHTDVVPVEGQAWTVPPFAGVIRDQRIYGRGATDMKGFLAVVLANVPRLKEVASVAPVHLAFSYDEEVGCRGAPDLVRVLMQSVAPPALAIVGEPTTMRVVRAHKGKVARRLTVTGRTGHSAMPHRAVDAAVAIAHKLRGLANEEIARGGDAAFDPPFTTIHVGSLHGGSMVNLVPERAVLEYEIRTMPGRDAGEILARIDELVARECDRPCQCSGSRHRFRRAVGLSRPRHRGRCISDASGRTVGKGYTARHDGGIRHRGRSLRGSRNSDAGLRTRRYGARAQGRRVDRLRRTRGCECDDEQPGGSAPPSKRRLDAGMMIGLAAMTPVCGEINEHDRRGGEGA